MQRRWLEDKEARVGGGGPGDGSARSRGGGATARTDAGTTDRMPENPR